MKKIFKQYVLLVFLISITSIFAGCGNSISSLQEDLEDTARENGKFSNVIVKVVGNDSFDILLNSRNSLSEEECDALAAKLLKQAFDYKGVNVSSVKIAIGEDVTNALQGNTYFDELASYELYSNKAKEINIVNANVDGIVQAAHKRYHKPTSDITRVNTKYYNDTKAKYGVN